jgi:uncharacterized protein (TIGR02145 family)
MGTIEAGDGLWHSPNTNATNETGFFAYPGGYRNNNGAFSYIGNSGYWWSATEYYSMDAMISNLAFNTSNLFRHSTMKGFGFLVRCIKD